MLINTKEVASLLFLEIAFANHSMPEQVLYETQEVATNFSEKQADNYLPRLGAYINTKTNAFISLQKQITKYLLYKMK